MSGWVWACTRERACRFVFERSRIDTQKMFKLRVIFYGFNLVLQVKLTESQFSPLFLPDNKLYNVHATIEN